jgi:hypothetical protein
MKIEQVIEYVADDGRRFSQKQVCEDYEREFAEVTSIMKTLPVPDLRHGEFVRVEKTLLLNVRRCLWKLIVNKYGDAWPEWKTWNADDVHPMSIVGRVLDDCDFPIERAWRRLACFDFDNGRICEQPYFVLHPEYAKEKA